ncbi:hypothetical protein BC781_102265 [Sediminitomix flava]|uniref:Uncharacterized protein n=1 Tax=Sediminitomix flava TaxID=379075 RepID=A0A315ZBI1_SEDFL|nr:hypothetical protein BC781_102265 [Sediminitomix flava]
MIYILRLHLQTFTKKTLGKITHITNDLSSNQKIIIYNAGK